jgi:stage III sporulation protein AA
MMTVMNVLPPTISRLLNRLPRDMLPDLEEIRIREGRPLEITVQGRFHFLDADGKPTRSADRAYRPDREDCRHLMDLLTNHSVYTLEEELKRGYITIAGGHRVGLSGKTVLEQGKVKHLREITSFNIRIAREVHGAARELMPKLYDAGSGSIYHTLIVSPPQQGKTTLIRDIARMLSTGGFEREGGMPAPPLKVGIVDERSEIAACIKGVPSFDVGPRTDVLDGCPKAEGMMMMIRAMSPDVIVVDEIGRPEDAEAIHEALHAGIRIVATAHGHNFTDIAGRPMLKDLVNEQIFQRYVILGHTYGIGRVFRIYDRDGRMIDSLIVRKTHA